MLVRSHALEADADAARELVAVEMRAARDRSPGDRAERRRRRTASSAGISSVMPARLATRARENQSARVSRARRAFPAARCRAAAGSRSASCRAGRNRPGRARPRPACGRAVVVALVGHDLVGLLARARSRRRRAWLKCAGCEPGAWVFPSSGRSFSIMARVLSLPLERPATPRVPQSRIGQPCVLPFPARPSKGASLFRRLAPAGIRRAAGVAELVDALDLGSSIARCGGSSPFARTSSPAPILGSRGR